MRFFACFLFLCLCCDITVRGNEKVDFGQEIRPILSDKCFACHGPDEEHREGGFRFDIKESALGTGDSGEPVITPGEPEKSEMMARIISEDEFMRMPPAHSHKPLKKEEIAKLKLWIEQGAEWEEHWSYQPLTRPELPEVSNSEWVQNPIDQFVLSRLQAEGLSPSLKADRTTLLRRVTFDLTGLPPTLPELDQFLADESPDAFEKVVDRLLASPRYGEHMARYWLDAARYGDTHGLHLDNYREIWPYRDWVIQAFNQNMPYDQFTIEQLAGDLLESPTRDQRIATGFIRCHVTTSEGGSIAQEVFTRNVVDRVNTFGTVFLGATFDCTRCHDHKYDPLTQQDYYSMFAFFNSLDGNPLDGNREDHAPIIKVPDEEQKAQLTRFDEELKQVNQQLAELNPQLNKLQKEWEQELTAQSGTAAESDWYVLTPEKYTSQGGATLTVQNDQSLLATGTNPATEVYEIITNAPAHPWQAIRLEGLIDPANVNGRGGRSSNSNVVLTEFELYQNVSENREQWERVGIKAAWADHEQTNGDFKIENAIDGQKQTGWATEGFNKTDSRTAFFVAAQPFGQQKNTQLKIVLKFESVYAQHQFGRVRLSAIQTNPIPNATPPEIFEIAKLKEVERTSEQKQKLQTHFRDNVTDLPAYLEKKKQRDEIAEQRKKFDEEIPTTLVYKEKAAPVTSHILKRGEYDQPGEEVPRATPGMLPGMKSEWPLNRLGLAKWLVSDENPLTARVEVNRRWQQLFGIGLVKTSEDFGSQGERPSHPELLDWLAVEFRESGWDIKQLMKILVMSATYQQSSEMNPALVAQDKENRLLAHGPRFRLDAEVLRDQALALSGLLVEDLGGPSVKPPQPDGLWFAVGYTRSNTARFKADEDPLKTHRRSLYTFIKRTAPPPQMSTLDAPSREASCVRRERTNTPLQALMLFNDPQYIEAASSLAARGMQEGGETPEGIARFLFRTCTMREPTPEQLELLVNGYQSDLAVYQQQPERSSQLNKVGSVRKSSKLDPQQLAAWTVTANLLLNLDIVLNKN